MLLTICSVTHHLPRPAPAPLSWQFDIVSALIGAVVALLLTGLVYRFRDALRRSGEALVAPLHKLSHWLQVSAEDEYRELVAEQARSLPISAQAAPLDAIFVEPELLAPASPPQSISEIDLLPASPRVLPLRRILGEHPQLVILGAPGSGKTTILAYIALVCARTADSSAESGTIPGLAQGRLPLYMLLPAMDWGEPGDEDKDEEDEEDQENQENEEEHKEAKQESYGIDELISTAVAVVKGNRAMRKTLRERFEAGQVIVLVDGWDELRQQQCERAAAWLSGLISAVPGNLWLIAAGSRGYAPLTEAGFVPLKLAPWDAKRVELFARQWVEVYTPTDADGERSPVTSRQLASLLRDAARGGASPLELALQAFVYLSAGQAPSRRAALFDHTLGLLLQQETEEPWLPETCRMALEEIALNLQQEGRTAASREEIDAAVEAALPLSEELTARAAARVFRTLTDEGGLLRQVDTDRYVFHHPLWQAFLAARQLADLDTGGLIEHLDDPYWAEVLRFYAEAGDMAPLVAAWLRRPDDMFRTRLRTLGSWIRAAPEDASWRNGAMAVLARSFLQASHPALVRQRLAEALAITRMSGVTYLFKQALQHPDAGTRRAAVMGLTRTARESDLPAFEAAMTDEDLSVREAAVRGLAHLGTDAATRLLARLLLEGDETLSLVAAEALTQCGEDGADFLSEALELEDMMARRAAVYGLARIGARALLEQAAREDDQWIVRSAAVAALEELEEQEKVLGVAPPIEIDQLSWLISWAAARGEGVGLGDAARPVLRRALSEGDAPTCVAAAQVLAQVGRPDDVEPLRKALASSDPAVVEAVLEALAGISERYALRIE